MLTLIIIKVLILFCALTLASPLLYAQNDVRSDKDIKTLFEADSGEERDLTKTSASVPPEEQTEERRDRSFWDFINKKAYAVTINKEEEKKRLREDWKELLGVDIYYPYFKAKDVEDWMSDKFKIKIFKIEGRPRFEDDQFKYIFKIKF